MKATTIDRRPELMAQLLRVRGYVVWTSPAASLDADQRARVVSGMEGVFLRKTDPTLDRIIFSNTEPCPACSEIHPC